MKKIFVLAFLSLFLLNSCSVNKAKTDDSLKQYFDENQTDGCFSLLDNRSGEITVYNMALDTIRFSPASTFKIINSLIALETGKASDENMVIKWDGIVRSNSDWNKDLTMKEAFKVSCVPWFQEMARRIGRDTLQHFLDSMHYGNATIGSRTDSFWLDNSLRISPDEQLGLMKRLYFDQLPFQKRTHQLVREMMQQEQNTQYSLSYKTGWYIADSKQSVGWVTGWVEENQHPYFFVLLVRSADPAADMKTIRLKILRNILTHYGFFKGDK